MTLFELEAKLGLNKDGFDKGVRDAEGSGKDLRDSLSDSFGKIKTAAKTLLGAAIFKEVIDAARELVGETAQVGDTIDKQSQVLGMSRKAYQEWDYILSQNGASIENLGSAMRGMNKIFMSAKEGNEEANDALAQLGVNVHELEMMEPEEQFETLVRAFQKMPAGAQKTALAMQIFGRSGMQLLPLLNSNADSIDTLRENAEELGLIMGDDAIDASVKYTDSLDTMQRTFNAFKYAIGSKLLPVLTKGMEKITAYAGKLRKAYDQNGFAGVFSTLINDLKAHWPTWDDIRGFVVKAWQKVQEGFTKIAKLVFGEDEDGNIKWPSAQEIFKKIGDGLTAMWNGIVGLAGDIMKLVFGEDEDGNIAWPSPEEIKKKIKQGLSDMWEGVKSLAGSIMKLIFGGGEDGGIEFPSGKELWQKIQSAIETMWSYIKSAASAILSFVFGEDENGNIIFPKPEELWEKIKEGFTTLWNGVKEFLIDAADWALGKLELPSVREMANTIIEWWNDVKRDVGNLLLNIFPFFGSSGIDNSPLIDSAGGSDDNTGGGGGHGFGGYAKGLWTVPYDNYLASLHKGEMVLTASQARRYREGGGNVDYAMLFGGIMGAIRDGMDGAQVNSYMDSTKVTNKTNNVTGRRLMARRFAPV